MVAAGRSPYPARPAMPSGPARGRGRGAAFATGVSITTFITVARPPGRTATGRQRVRIGGKTWPRDRPWVILVVAATVAAAAAWGWEWTASGRMPGGSSRSGLVHGVLGGLIILFELALWPRRRVRSWRLGSAQAWLRAHVWLGLLCLPLVLMHARLLFIGGLLNWALMICFLVVIASGIWGLWLQQWMPIAMLERVPAETIHDQIDHVARQACRDLERLVDAVCERPPGQGHGAEADDADEFAVVTGFRAMTGIQGKVIETLPLYATIPGTLPVRQAFLDEIRPYLLAGEAGGSPLRGPAESGRFFAGLRQAAPAEAAALVAQLEQACDQRRQLDLQRRLHGWLHAWLLVHVPLSAALGILLAVHVPVALWYW